MSQGKRPRVPRLWVLGWTVQRMAMCQCSKMEGLRKSMPEPEDGFSLRAFCKQLRHVSTHGLLYIYNIIYISSSVHRLNLLHRRSMPQWRAPTASTRSRVCRTSAAAGGWIAKLDGGEGGQPYQPATCLARHIVNPHSC